jgi:predicted acyltransferase
VGLALTPLIPMVKRLWTPSFTFFSAGWVIVVLMRFYWTIEVRKWKNWAFPVLIFGMNSIFAYSIGQIGLKGRLNRGLASFTGNFSLLGDLGAIPQQALARTSHTLSAAARDKAASTSLRSLTVLDVLFKYASAR